MFCSFDLEESSRLCSPDLVEALFPSQHEKKWSQPRPFAGAVDGAVIHQTM